MVSEQNSKFAPAGYGYGEILPTIEANTDEEIKTALDTYLHKLKNNETMQINISGGAETVTKGTSFCGTLTKTTYDYATFFVNGYLHKGCLLLLTKYGGVWGEWEWVNPPMIPGDEYRTTERWMGKPVYTCLVNCGNPTIGVASTPHDLNIKQCISCEACSSISESLPVRYIDSSVDDTTLNAYANNNYVHVYTSGNYDLTCTIYARLRYTKN